VRLRHGLALSAATCLGFAASQALAQNADRAPPSRVGQVALLRGGVSFNAQGAKETGEQGTGEQGTGGWTAAQLNYPVTTGDTLYTQPDAEAAIAVDWSQITLSGGTEFAVTSLGNRTVQATEAQGEVYLDLRYLPKGNQFIITTPRGTVTIGRGGRYDIIAGDQNTPTRITVMAGFASVNGQNVAVSVGPGEAAVLNGDNPVTVSLGGAQSDRFMARLRRAAVQAPPSYVPQSVSQMTGGYELSQYGRWSRESNYGAVWYPRVAPSWVPYRSGHWSYVEPWGWTWVASEPWGFAPFHYGRWVDIGGRWGWAPSPVQSEGYSYATTYSWPVHDQPYSEPVYYQQPVYAPALVSFFAIGAGAAITAGSIGWVPLAPDEPYYPPYRCPRRYIRQINVSNVRNVARIDNSRDAVINDHGPNRLVNRHAATVIAAAAMRQGDPVAHFGRPAPRTILAAARSVPFAGIGTPPPAGFGHAVPARARLPAAPPPLARQVPAPAPDPAVFAAARGIPVAHPRPVRPAAARNLGVPHPLAVSQSAPHGPAVDHPAPFSHAPANQPSSQPDVVHPPVLRPGTAAAQPPAHFAAPGFQHQLRQVPPPPRAASKLNSPRAAHVFNPPQAVHAFAPPRAAQHVQVPGRLPVSVYHPPAYPPVYHAPILQQRPIYHPPIYQPSVQPPRSAMHPPAQQVFHPPAQPVFHPPVQPAFRPPVQPAFHPPAQPAFHPPAFHPPVQQPRLAPSPAPRPQPDQRP
jgi:hypothetical protein